MASNSVVRAIRCGGGTGGALAACFLVLAGSCSSGAETGSDEAPVAAETGQDHGQAYFNLDVGPPHDYFIGAWTHVVPPMGSGPKGNDSPFAMYCAEGEVSFVSGNFVTPYSYNANIMTFDRGGNYIADYAGLQATDTTEAMCRDWIYLGWHFQRTNGSTNVTQYVKYVGSSNLVDSTVVENVPGHWTPTRVCVGTDPDRFAGTPMYIMYARIYARDTPPSAAEVQAIYQHSATPDANAWADWPLIAGSPADVSGHGRDLNVIGNVASGILGPPVLPAQRRFDQRNVGGGVRLSCPLPSRARSTTRARVSTE